jgi:hypothetical protein
MAVKFLVQAQVGTLYNKGDIAGFDEKTEQQLVEAKVAVAYKDPKPKTAEGQA